MTKILLKKYDKNTFKKSMTKILLKKYDKNTFKKIQIPFIYNLSDLYI
jgi:hypothetical protein